MGSKNQNNKILIKEKSVKSSANTHIFTDFSKLKDFLKTTVLLTFFVVVAETKHMTPTVKGGKVCLAYSE